MADLSHWVTVAETNPNDPDLTAVIEMLAPMFHHTHCRFDLVGVVMVIRLVFSKNDEHPLFVNSLLYMVET